MDDRYDLPDFDPDLLKAVDNIKNELFPEPGFKVGRIVSHVDGYRVRITAGMFWDGDGPERRLSNHWTWHPVDENGARSGPDEKGYGDLLIDPRLH
ncbi:hypothetical protein D3C71_315780 [compost metagenome]